MVFPRTRGVDAGAREWRRVTRFVDPESVSDLSPLGAAIALAARLHRGRVPLLGGAQGLHTVAAFSVCGRGCESLAVARVDTANAANYLGADANFPIIRPKLTVFPLAMASVLDTVV